MARRFTLSTALLAGAATLVVAIVVGNSMGNRVLGQIGRAPNLSATPFEIPSPGTTPAATQGWKHVSLAAIATDPAFPDPRVSPPPPPPPPPPPREPPHVATPRPSPTRYVAAPTPIASFDYTSPPLPVPIATANVDLPSSAPVASPAPPPSPPAGGERAGAPGAKPTGAGRPTPNAVGP